MLEYYIPQILDGWIVPREYRPDIHIIWTELSDEQDGYLFQCEEELMGTFRHDPD